MLAEYVVLYHVYKENWKIVDYSYHCLSVCLSVCVCLSLTLSFTAAVAKWAKAFASQAEGWVFDYQPQQTYVVKTGSDSLTVAQALFLLTEDKSSFQTDIISVL